MLVRSRTPKNSDKWKMMATLFSTGFFSASFVWKKEDSGRKYGTPTQL
jgi:hypothetical protein